MDLQIMLKALVRRAAASNKMDYPDNEDQKSAFSKRGNLNGGRLQPLGGSARDEFSRSQRID
jgi:hypothetical protein